MVVEYDDRAGSHRTVDAAAALNDEAGITWLVSLASLLAAVAAMALAGRLELFGTRDPRWGVLLLRIEA